MTLVIHLVQTLNQMEAQARALPTPSHSIFCWCVPLGPRISGWWIPPASSALTKKEMDFLFNSIALARPGSSLFRELKGTLLHRCIQWEDIGQFQKASQCECGASGCMLRLKNLEKLSMGPPQDQGLIESVVSGDGGMWGWPEEERWYSMELAYAGQVSGPISRTLEFC